MNRPAESPLVYPRADPPPFGEPLEVQPGIIWLRLPLPFALDHVNLWILDDGDGWLLVDTGYADDACRAIWDQQLDGWLAGRPITRILATHFHPDHVGLAGWLCDRTGAPLLMNRTEWLTGRMLALDTSEGFVAAGDAFYRDAGLDVETVVSLNVGGNRYRRGVVLPPPVFVPIGEGGSITAGGSTWRVIIGEGHAPEQITLHSAERGILIAADQVLPRISPNVGVWPSMPDADPLDAFLLSLERYADIPEDTLVLPSHGLPFRGLHARIAELCDHHDERLAVSLDACAGADRTARDVMLALFRRELDIHQTMFAVGETIAHLNYLVGKGAVHRRRADGALRYRRA